MRPAGRRRRARGRDRPRTGGRASRPSPPTRSSASTGAAAASASTCHGHARTRCSRADDASGDDADGEQRGEVGRRLDHERVEAGDVRSGDPDRVTTSVTAATMATAPQRRTSSRSSGNSTYSCASTAIDQNDRSGLGTRTRFCSSRPLTTTDLASGRALSRRRDDQPGHRQAEHQRRPVRRQDPARPAAREPRDPVEAPAAAGGRERQREARQHDEHHDGEAAVDEPAGPERRVVDRVARERAQEDVVHDHEQRREATEAVQPGDARADRGPAGRRPDEPAPAPARTRTRRRRAQPPPKCPRSRPRGPAPRPRPDAAIDDGGQCSNRQRDAPCGSAVATPNPVWIVNRYRCHGGGPALGAL